MARKNNGFGSSKSFAAKGVDGVSGKITGGFAPKAAGVYPSNRRYGTVVQRTIIERYNLESDWIRWRKGYEYYAQAVFEELRQRNPLTGEYEDTVLRSKLYQGTPYEVEVVFTGQRYATKDSDSNNHYVLKRELAPGASCNLFRVTEVFDDPTTSAIAAEAKERNELWVRGFLTAKGELLLRMTGERLADGNSRGELPGIVVSTGSLSYVLNEKQQPALYIGKTLPEGEAVVSVTVPLAAVNASSWVAENGLAGLIGKVAYVPNFYIDKSINDVDEISFIDDSYYFDVKVSDSESNEDLKILDPENFPFDVNVSLFDISNLTEIVNVKGEAESRINATYTYDKAPYQRFFGDQYLTAELVESQIFKVSYTVLPFIINSYLISEDGSEITFSSVPYLSEFNLMALGPNTFDATDQVTLVFSDYGFSNTQVDTVNGEYPHPIEGPYSTVREQIEGEPEFADLVWYRIINDIDPYDPATPVFPRRPFSVLRPATMYSCSCPSFSQAILRMPQTTEMEETRKVNRQRNYPLPTAQGRSDYESVGLGSAAGVLQSWANPAERLSFKLCKHMISSMFHDHFKLQEPSSYQSLDARLAFEAKLVADVELTKEMFNASYERGGISTLEVVFALAQGLNLDEVETAFVVLNSKF